MDGNTDRWNQDQRLKTDTVAQSGTEMKTLAFTLPLIIFPFDIRFSFGETDEEVKRFLKRNEIDPSKLSKVIYANTEGVAAVFEGESLSIVRLPNVPKTPFEFAALQHEITHMVMLILHQAMETPHNMDTTEIYAYLTDYITEQVYKRIWK